MSQLRSIINLDAIAHNTRVVKAEAGGAKLMCVVKADGYNHGMRHVAEVMAANGADQFGVATLEEAVLLRDAGIMQPILFWLWTPTIDLSPAFDRGLDIGVAGLEHVRAVVAAGQPARVTVGVDTGLNRSGIDEEDWARAFTLLAMQPQITVTGLFSHLSSADELGSTATDEQVATFKRALAIARACGLDPRCNHLANSPGLLMHDDFGLEMVRPGLACYGYSPLPTSSYGSELRPAMTWEADVVTVKRIRAGEGASYNLTWHAPSDGYTAIVPVGYADGLPREVQGSFAVTINGRRYPQVGRVCMDQIVVWLGATTDVEPGDTALLFGPGDRGEMTATEVADAAGTINYEILCTPRGRTERVYVGG
ncbi:alanine racemase [Corynebacterium epidermidicanis]|uniref:Alanine racemase n=1 Tax=Corynebacterium epidermidicanis TaxID=1050174 RepID=A0A0G3GM95_9CORY|nr:alanine racemase [Corynebacterium epidermidicanis]AKK02356.1 alanine racemase [Corynebacterium epidermidicanis]